MKITQSQLKQIIKEELSAIINERFDSAAMDKYGGVRPQDDSFVVGQAQEVFDRKPEIKGLYNTNNGNVVLVLPIRSVAGVNAYAIEFYADRLEDRDYDELINLFKQSGFKAYGGLYVSVSPENKERLGIGK